MMEQIDFITKLREEYNKRIEMLATPFVGTYQSFKEARKNAREVAKVSNHRACITKKVIENEKRYVVTLDDDDNNCDYYVHIDGRVCKVEDLEKEKNDLSRYPDKANLVYPFSMYVENRKRNENKKDYKLRMSIQNPCRHLKEK